MEQMPPTPADRAASKSILQAGQRALSKGLLAAAEAAPVLPDAAAFGKMPSVPRICSSVSLDGDSTDDETDAVPIPVDRGHSLIEGVTGMTAEQVQAMQTILAARREAAGAGRVVEGDWCSPLIDQFRGLPESVTILGGAGRGSAEPADPEDVSSDEGSTEFNFPGRRRGAVAIKSLQVQRPVGGRWNTVETRIYDTPKRLQALHNARFNTQERPGCSAKLPRCLEKYFSKELAKAEMPHHRLEAALEAQKPGRKKKPPARPASSEFPSRKKKSKVFELTQELATQGKILDFDVKVFCKENAAFQVRLRRLKEDVGELEGRADDVEAQGEEWVQERKDQVQGAELLLKRTREAAAAKTKTFVASLPPTRRASPELGRPSSRAASEPGPAPPPRAPSSCSGGGRRSPAADPMKVFSGWAHPDIDGRSSAEPPPSGRATPAAGVGRHTPTPARGGRTTPAGTRARKQRPSHISPLKTAELWDETVVEESIDVLERRLMHFKLHEALNLSNAQLSAKEEGKRKVEGKLVKERDEVRAARERSMRAAVKAAAEAAARADRIGQFHARRRERRHPPAERRDFFCGECKVRLYPGQLAYVGCDETVLFCAACAQAARQALADQSTVHEEPSRSTSKCRQLSGLDGSASSWCPQTSGGKTTVEAVAAALATIAQKTGSPGEAAEPPAAAVLDAQAWPSATSAADDGADAASSSSFAVSESALGSERQPPAQPASEQAPLPGESAEQPQAAPEISELQEEDVGSYDAPYDVSGCLRVVGVKK
eukprot:TRINITY_DN38966_c0_g1_i1.p1 TRINITY_DN38966_c0_g1~~TRINITY_DN38966_c0_g1_i1.p1  ORF type:complete len:774 (-),score=180.99 TRINITY_DN38966_c0_g1_i1:149-2470(-)